MSASHKYVISLSFFFVHYSFIGISNSLPQTSGMKMIEFWMIFTMMYPFTLVLLHIINQVNPLDIFYFLLLENIF